MTKLKYHFMVLLALLLSISTFAQRPHRGAQPPRMETMKEELQLSEQQLEQIEAIQEKYRAQRRVLREQYGGDREEGRDAWHKLREAQHTEIHDVLTEEQRAILEEKRTTRAAERARRRAESTQLRQEVKNYRDANIMPVLKEQRAKLEMQLSGKDKALIAELRARHDALRTKMKEAQNDPEKRKALREELKQQGAEKEQLRGLIEKYEADIERLFTEIVEKRQQWRRDLKQLHDTYRPDGGEEAPRFHRDGPRGRRIRPHHRQHRPGSPRDGLIGKGAFLLLNPEADTPETIDIEELMPGIDPEVFPNPAGQLNTVRYKIKNPGEVRIELRDGEGRLLQVLLDEYRARGTYTEDVDLSPFANGVYYYSITTEEGTVTKKVIVSKQ